MGRTAQTSPIPADESASFGGHKREHPLRQSVLGAIVTAMAYFITARLGEALAFPSAPVSALWAPNAILLAALVLMPVSRWWLPLLAVLITHFAAQAPTFPLAQVTIQYLANCSVAVLGAAALIGLNSAPLRFNTLRSAIHFILFSGTLAPLVTSIAMAAAFVAFGLTSNFWLTAIVRTATNAFAILTLVPLILHAAARLGHGRVRIAWSRVVEAMLLITCLAVVGALVFIFPPAGPRQSPAMLYAPLPMLLWAAVRFGTTGVCASMLVLGALSTWGVLNGNGPFVSPVPVQNALSVVLFLVVTCIPLLLLAGLLREQKDTARALAESEASRRGTYELQRAVLASLEAQVAVLDNDGTVLEINDSWRSRTGRPDAGLSGAVPGMNYLETVHAAVGGGTVSNETLLAVQEVLSAENLRRRLECAVRLPEGVRWTELSVERLQRPEGGAVVTLADITARRNAELEARSRYQQLAHLARAAILGEISGAIAHEINQPLSAILGNAQAALRLLAAQQVDLEEIREILQDIVGDDMRASEVVKRVRAMLRDDELRPEPQDLNALAADVLGLVHGDLVRRSVALETDLEPHLGLVRGDRVQLQQVILNLIVNACEAMNDTPPQERALHLVTRRGPRNGEIELCVRDRGPGIANDQRERIFHPFVTTKVDGLGLGLSISRSIVKAHGGRLWAEAGDRGAVFRMTLQQV